MPANKVKITTILHVHPSHLKPSTIKFIKANSSIIGSTNTNLPADNDHGFISGIVMPTGTIIAQMPNDLIEVLRFAKHRGHSTVIITDSTSINADLPVYEPDQPQGQRLEFISYALRVAYDQAAMKPTDFPAKIEIQYCTSGKDNTKPEIPNFAIFDAENPQDISNKWSKYCDEKQLPKDSVTGLEMLCKI